MSHDPRQTISLAETRFNHRHDSIKHVWVEEISLNDNYDVLEIMQHQISAMCRIVNPGLRSEFTFGIISLLELDDAIVDHKIDQFRHGNDTGAYK